MSLVNEVLCDLAARHSPTDSGIVAKCTHTTQIGGAPIHRSTLHINPKRKSTVIPTLLSAGIILGTSAVFHPARAPVESQKIQSNRSTIEQTQTRFTGSTTLSEKGNMQNSDYTTKLILASFVADENPIKTIDQKRTDSSPLTKSENRDQFLSTPFDEEIHKNAKDNAIQTLPPLSSIEIQSGQHISRAKWHKIDPRIEPTTNNQTFTPSAITIPKTPNDNVRPQSPPQDLKKNLPSNKNVQSMERSETSGDSFIEVKQRPLSEEEQRIKELRPAVTAYKKGDHGEAEHLLEQLLEADINHHEARLLLVRSYTEQGLARQAELTLATAILTFPQYIPYVQHYVQMLVEDGREFAAIDAVKQALPDAADNADLHALLAGLYQRTDQAVAAAESYQVALGLDPVRGEWWMGLGISSEQSGDKIKAEEAYKEALKLPVAAKLEQFIEKRLQQLVSRRTTGDSKNE